MHVGPQATAGGPLHTCTQETTGLQPSPTGGIDSITSNLNAEIYIPYKLPVEKHALNTQGQHSTLLMPHTDRIFRATSPEPNEAQMQAQRERTNTRRLLPLPGLQGGGFPDTPQGHPHLFKRKESVKHQAWSNRYIANETEKETKTGKPRSRDLMVHSTDQRPRGQGRDRTPFRLDPTASAFPANP